MRRGLAEQLLAVKHQTPLDLHRPIGLTKPGADVAKSVDAADLKSAGLVSCGFKSRRPHHPGSNGIAFSSVTFRRGPSCWQPNQRFAATTPFSGIWHEPH